MRQSQQAKEKQKAHVEPALEQAQSPFARIPQVCALRALPETGERDNKDFVVLYDTFSGVIYSPEEGGAPELF